MPLTGKVHRDCKDPGEHHSPISSFHRARFLQVCQPSRKQNPERPSISLGDTNQICVREWRPGLYSRTGMGRDKYHRLEINFSKDVSSHCPSHPDSSGRYGGKESGKERKKSNPSFLESLDPRVFTHILTETRQSPTSSSNQRAP